MSGPASLPPFGQYVALGDSMSIDRYPSIDLLAAGIGFVPQHHETELPRASLTGHYAELPVGAASLLAQNDDELWPDFAGRDLATLLPRLRAVSAAFDGATITDVVQTQLPRIPASAEPVLVTLTAGGNDLLVAFGAAGSNRELQDAVRGIVREYERCVDAIRARLSEATVILTTVYDPSDGTGLIPGFHESGRPLPLHFLEEVNAAIRGTPRGRRWAVVAEAHAHFMGHGAADEAGDPWYWPRSMIEPSARGASEIRRLWLGALGA